MTQQLVICRFPLFTSPFHIFQLFVCDVLSEIIICTFCLWFTFWKYFVHVLPYDLPSGIFCSCFALWFTFLDYFVHALPYDLLCGNMMCTFCLMIHLLEILYARFALWFTFWKYYMHVLPYDSLSGNIICTFWLMIYFLETLYARFALWFTFWKYSVHVLPYDSLSGNIICMFCLMIYLWFTKKYMLLCTVIQWSLEAILAQILAEILRVAAATLCYPKLKALGLTQMFTWWKHSKISPRRFTPRNIQ